MTFNFLKANMREQKMLSWSAVGLLVFISSFLWSPTRDGVEGVYLLGFFIPMLFVVLFRKPNVWEYGGWMTVLALVYAGYATLSSLWGNSNDIGFFILQWSVLATWLCGSSLLFVRCKIDISRYEVGFVILGTLITVSALFYHYGFAFGKAEPDPRLSGWNLFKNPNDMGAMCGVIALLATHSALQCSSLKRASMFYLMAALACTGLVASASRGALVSFVVMFFAAVFAVRPAFKIWIPPLVVGVSVAVMLLTFTDVVKGFNDRSLALEQRKEVWRYAFHETSNHFFVGIGMAKDTYIHIPEIAIFNHAHNAWLDTVLRTGMIGLVLSLLSMAAVLKHFSRDSKLLPLYLWFGYGCICRLVDSRCLFWQIDAKWFLYWLPLGLIIASITAASALASPNHEKSHVVHY